MNIVTGALCAALLSVSSVVYSPQQPESRFFLDYGYVRALPAETEVAFETLRYRPQSGTQIDSVFQLEPRLLRRVEFSTFTPNGDTLTTMSSWRANGQLREQVEMLNRKRHGTHLLYNSTGHVVQKSVFKQDVEQACYDAQGAILPCLDHKIQPPEYPGGLNKMMQFLASNIRYPKAALRARTEGLVHVSFIIDETGKPRNLRVSKSVSPELDAEALRVLRLLPPFRPGTQYGEPVPVFVMAPVTFNIR
jgi:TonB family protein